MKEIFPLTDAEVITLKEVIAHHPNGRMRQRAEAVLLSHRSYQLAEIAHILDLHRNTVSLWLDVWEDEGLMGLRDRDRSGRPSTLTPEEFEQVRAWVDEHPQMLKLVVARIAETFGKKISVDRLRRLLRKAGYRWRRCRLSLKSRRDEAAFKQEQTLLQKLHEQEQLGNVNVVFFDGSGFSLKPVVPYAWQAPGEVLELPASSHGQRLNVLGFLQNTSNTFFHLVKGRVDSAAVIEAFDAFCETLTGDRLTLVVMDNASMHHTEAFYQCTERWKAKKLFIHYLPPYSPELNRIERLWREIKYRWLPLWAYQSWDDLQKAVKEVLDQIGTKFQLTFT